MGNLPYLYFVNCLAVLFNVLKRLVFEESFEVLVRKCHGNCEPSTRDLYLRSCHAMQLAEIAEKI